MKQMAFLLHMNPIIIDSPSGDDSQFVFHGVDAVQFLGLLRPVVFMAACFHAMLSFWIRGHGHGMPISNACYTSCYLLLLCKSGAGTVC